MTKLKSVLQQWLKKPFNRSVFHFILLLSIILGNIYFQAFCVPTAWAMLVIGIVFAYTVMRPLLAFRYSNHKYLSVLDGLSVMLFLYCVAFIETSYIYALIGILLYGLGLLAFVPIYFIFYYIRIYSHASIKRSAKRIFIATLLICSCLVGYSAYVFRKASLEVNKLIELGPAEFEDSFMAERIIGMHMIYHTKIEVIYDGWRSPKHDPLLVLGYLLNGRVDPLSLNLEERIALYRATYPNKPIKFDCSCAMSYSDSYHKDKRLQ